MKRKNISKSFASKEVAVQAQVACLSRIYRTVEHEGLNDVTLSSLADDIKLISDQYELDEKSVILLAAILEKTNTPNPMYDSDLAEYLGCSNIEFLCYRKALRKMEQYGYIMTHSLRGSGTCYRVASEALKAIETEGKFIPIKMIGLTSEELFSRIRKAIGEFGRSSISADCLLEELDSLVEGNSTLPFCKEILDSPIYDGCTDTERRIFFHLCHRYVNHGELSVDLDTLVQFTDYYEDESVIKRSFLHQDMWSQEKGLICFANEDGLVNNEALSLSDRVRETFFTDIEIASESPIDHPDVIHWQTISAKDLFYNEAEGAQIARLAGLLDSENFKQVQNRLNESGMRKGFNAVFYGAPGTGKTASVLELARRSGRDIFKVDMAKLKSKWVGDSEKSVRGAFQLYRHLCKQSDKAPILLFNEADAIFAKRFENVAHSVDQMNNSIQNIILEEMERLDGILIATTNLITNLDEAFERRFIFKVEFKLPEKDSRAKIWKSMIPAISEEDANVLADRYTFTGGNIENIARKSTVEYVLSGIEPTLSVLDGYCREEVYSRKANRKPIGF